MWYFGFVMGILFFVSGLFRIRSDVRRRKHCRVRVIGTVVSVERRIDRFGRLWLYPAYAYFYKGRHRVISDVRHRPGQVKEGQMAHFRANGQGLDLIWEKTYRTAYGLLCAVLGFVFSLFCLFQILYGVMLI